jgi:O-antigen/teichoic acid export membrane protein
MRRALAITTSERYFGLLANFATIAVVSRILSPSEIGISVVGMAIVGLTLALREFATTNFLVQKNNLTTTDVRTAFTVLLLLTTAIAVSLWATAGPLANFYGSGDLVPYLRVVALSLFAEIFFLPISALLRRQMAFSKLAVLNIIAATVTSTTTIALALLGFSYMSFAWAILASTSVASILSIKIWKDRSIFRLSLAEWRSFVAFGGYHGVNILLYQLYEALPYLILGRTLSLHSVALYNRGITICQLPHKIVLGGVGTVLLSSYSAEVRSGGNLRASYLRGIEMITALQWPGFILVAILAHPIVTLLLGAQWVDVVPIVQIMALASLFTFSGVLNYPILVAVGAMRDVLIRSVIVWPLSALIIAAASLFGLEAAALAWLVTMPLQAYFSVSFVRRHVPVTWRQIGGSLWRAGVLALLSGLGPIMIVLIMGRFDLPMPAVAAAIALSAIGWWFGLVLTAHPLLREIERAIDTAARNVPALRVTALRMKAYIPSAIR